MAIEWSTNYPTTQDTDPNADTEQPDLVDESAPDAADGDAGRVSQILTLRNKLHALAKVVGDDNNNPPGSLKSIIDTSTGSTTWKYFPTTNPTGVVAPPEVVYQFDGTGASLTDRTANGHDLTIGGGGANLIHMPVLGFLGLYFDETTFYTAPISVGLQITGALTIEATVFLAEYSGVDDMIVSHGITGETEPTNSLYRIEVKANTGNFTYFSENGAGINDFVTFNAVCPIATIQHITLTRNGTTGDVKLYQDAVLIGSSAGVLPTGGTSGQFALGIDGTGFTEPWHGNIFSFRMTPEEFTASQVLESYQQAKGIV